MDIRSSKGLPIVLNYADTETVEELIQLIMRQAEDLDLTDIIARFSSHSVAEVLESDVANLLPFLPLLQKLLCRLEGSKEYRNMIYRLLSNCTYNGIGITKQLFTDMPELREDYYMLEWEVVKFNVFPFFKRLLGRYVQVTPQVTNSSNPT